MKKVMTGITIALLSFLMFSCVEIEDLSSVVSIELANWSPQEKYEYNVDNYNIPEDASVTVTYDTGDTDTITLGTEGLEIGGTGAIDGELKTNAIGTYTVRISFGGVTLNLEYGVVEHLVTTVDDFAVKISAADVGDTIYVAPGIYNLSSAITVNNEVTIEGSESVSQTGKATKLVGYGTYQIFNITSPNVTIINLEMYLAAGVYAPTGTSEAAGSIIRISSANATIEDNIIYGSYEPTMPLPLMYTRGITAAPSSHSSVEDETNIEGNMIYNVRNGIVINSNIGTFNMIDNIVFATKGGIMNYTTESTCDGRIMTGNTWVSPDSIDDFLDHNEWDIVWNSATYNPTSFAENLTLSVANGGAYVLDRRSNPAANLYNNRSHVFVNPAVGSDVINDNQANGNFTREQFETVGVALTAVTKGGTIMLWNDVSSQYEVYTFSDAEWDAANVGRTVNWPN